MGTEALTEAFRAEQVSLDELWAAEWNANRVPDAVLAKGARSIEDFGVVENLLVRPHPDGRGYEVISGNHRLLLYREMGMGTAPCRVVEVDDAHARILAQTLNRTRGDDDPKAKARLLEDVLRSVPVEHAWSICRRRSARSTACWASFVPTRVYAVTPEDVPEPPEEPRMPRGGRSGEART